MEHDIWEREEDLRNTRELVDKFKGRLSAEVRRQKRIGKKRKNPGVEEFKRIELPGKYTAKLLYSWDNGKFKAEYLRKLERNWRR